MRALVWHGKEDIRCDTVSDPQIEGPRDAIIKVTSCAICGSDLHLFHNYIPAMLPGDIMGHETMGEVVEVGSGLNGALKKGTVSSSRSRSSVASASSAGQGISPAANELTVRRIWRKKSLVTRWRGCSAILI